MNDTKHVQKPLVDSKGFFGTEDSKATVLEMKKRLGGRTIFRYSGGKDSTAAWLYLREHGFEVVPYVVASLSSLIYFEKTMAYYEDLFKTKILRFQCGMVTDAVACLLYQPLEDEEWINDSKLWGYHISSVGTLLAEKYGIEDWQATGLSMYDTMNRYYIGKYRGIVTTKKNWHPCWDWKPTQILGYLKRNKVSLGLDYTMDKTSMDALPIYNTLLNMREKYPEEFRRFRRVFPFCEARLARNVFREKRLLQEK